ncbi:MAG: addiction module protein [Proteobacteria bacterium]|nr:addiction module protein [Pseudomonadota bacterium]
MDEKTEKTISEALVLPVQIRAWLAEKLLESLETVESIEISDEWKDEIAKRCAEIDNELVDLKDADEVFKTAYEALG